MGKSSEGMCYLACYAVYLVYIFPARTSWRSRFSRRWLTASKIHIPGTYQLLRCPGFSCGETSLVVPQSVYFGRGAVRPKCLSPPFRDRGNHQVHIYTIHIYTVHAKLACLASWCTLHGSCLMRQPTRLDAGPPTDTPHEKKHGVVYG